MQIQYNTMQYNSHGLSFEDDMIQTQNNIQT